MCLEFGFVVEPVIVRNVDTISGMALHSRTLPVPAHLGRGVQVLFGIEVVVQGDVFIEQVVNE